MANDIDISENELLQQSKEVLELLLKDHTTQKNIFWATNSYAVYGEGYTFFDAITIERITGEKGLMIRPRAAKSKGEQTERTKEMAEVFTPSWVCNAQNNLLQVFRLKMSPHPKRMRRHFCMPLHPAKRLVEMGKKRNPLMLNR